MSNLKSLRTRIKSVQSTKKITAAMRMIAAAKLKKSQHRLLAARPYATYMRQMINNLNQYCTNPDEQLSLMYGRKSIKTTLIIVATSNRGLCGGFNTALVRQTNLVFKQLQTENKQVKIVCMGHKGYDQLHRKYGDSLVDYDIFLKELSYSTIQNMTDKLIKLFNTNVFDQCLIIYNQFISPLTQEITCQQLIPTENTSTSHTISGTDITESSQKSTVMQDDSLDKGYSNLKDKKGHTVHSVYDFEPDQNSILTTLLPKNLTTQIYTALLENDASEQGARMAAMEGATRNAQDMIANLSLDYNRTRQSYITKELIEIISGADAL